MSVYKRPESSRYVIEIRWQGLPRLKLSTGSSSKKLAEAMQRTLHGLKDAGRLDVLRLLAEGKLRLADVHEDYVRNPAALQHRLAAVASPTLGPLLDQWFAWLDDPATLSSKTRRAYAPKTTQRYKVSWARVLALLPRGREATLADMTKGFLADFRAQRRREGAREYRARPGHRIHQHPGPHARRRVPPLDRIAARRRRIGRSTDMAATLTAPTAVLSRPSPKWRAPLATLTRRRFALTARTPRELFVPLLTPILFAVVIAPALAKTVGSFKPGIDYMTFVALATAGLLIPLNTMFSGIGVIVDRETGARRDLLAAPIPRPLLVLGNLAVAFAITALQVIVLIGAAALRGADFHVTAAGAMWFVGGAGLLAVGMYGVAETLANRVPNVEEYIAATPAIAIVPWFFAGSLFAISSLPTGLAWVARFLPLTHALALMRYGLLDRSGSSLRDIWGMHDPTVMAFLSLAVVAVFAVIMTAVSIRVFTRAAVR